MAALNRPMAATRPGPSRLLGAKALRIASPIVSRLAVGPGVLGGDVSEAGGVCRPLAGVATKAGAGDCIRDKAGESRSIESDNVPKIWRCEGGM